MDEKAIKEHCMRKLVDYRKKPSSFELGFIEGVIDFAIFQTKKALIEEIRSWLLDNESYIKNPQHKEVSFRRILEHLSQLEGKDVFEYSIYGDSSGKTKIGNWTYKKQCFNCESKRLTPFFFWAYGHRTYTHKKCFRKLLGIDFNKSGGGGRH